MHGALKASLPSAAIRWELALAPGSGMRARTRIRRLLSGFGPFLLREAVTRHGCRNPWTGCCSLGS